MNLKISTQISAMDPLSCIENHPSFHDIYRIVSIIGKFTIKGQVKADTVLFIWQSQKKTINSMLSNNSELTTKNF